MMNRRRQGKGKHPKIKHIIDEDDNAYDPTHDPDTTPINHQISRKRRTSEISSKKEYAESNTKLFDQLWKPTKMSDLLINAKKVDEFKQFMNSDKKKILIIQGPSGWGKNTLIETYCAEHNLQVTKFKNTRMLSYNDILDTNTREKTSDDFEALVNFIHESWHINKLRSNTNDTNKKSLFKAFRTKLTLQEIGSKTKNGSKKNTKKKTRISQKTYDGKVAIVNGLPECMKVYSYSKLDMLADFNKRLLDLLDTNNWSLLVFIFSEQRERNKAFLSKIFNDSILKRPNTEVKRLELNPLTDPSITKIVKQVVNEQGIQLGANVIEDIIKNSNKDARHALQTLQFYAAGKTGYEYSNLNHQSKRKNKNNKLKTSVTQNSQFGIDEDEFFNQTAPKTKKVSGNGVNNTQNAKEKGKDYGLSIFHGLGKFLYNKRIDVKDKNTAKQMTFERLSVKPKPKSYINHLEILNQVQTENTTFSLFLEENMYDFFDDVEDISNVLNVYWDNDWVMGSTTYSFANQKYLYELSETASLSEALAITEYNMHGGNVKNKLKQMRKPLHFDLRNQRGIVEGQLRDWCKISQLSEVVVASSDILISDRRKVVTEYLPYISYMPFIHPLRPILKFNNMHADNTVREDELYVDSEHLPVTRRKVQHTRDGVGWSNTYINNTGIQEDIEDSDDDIDDKDIEEALLEMSSIDEDALDLSD